MSSFTIHETERLSLQTWDLRDFDAFASIARDPAVMKYIADGLPWSDSRIGWFMGLQHAHQHSLGYCCWKLIEKETSDLIGFCGLAPVFSLDETEIGWWLKRTHWHRGFASEAARRVERSAFAEHGLERVVARVYANNLASIRLIEKLGMKLSGSLDPTPVGSVLLFEKENQ